MGQMLLLLLNNTITKASQSKSLTGRHPLLIHHQTDSCRRPCCLLFMPALEFYCPGCISKEVEWYWELHWYILYLYSILWCCSFESDSYCP